MAGPLPLADWTGPHRTESAEYDVLVSSQIGEFRGLRAMYVLRTAPAGDASFTVVTTSSRGVWQEGAYEAHFDSTTPLPGEPWPVTLLYAVSAVPAAVGFSADGLALSLLDPDGWRMEGMRAITDLELPSEALGAGTALLDPEGIVRDLQRYFCGTPPEGTWVRQDRLADVPVRRVESCAAPAVDPTGTQWTCSGRIEGVGSAGPTVRGTSLTQIRADGGGLAVLSSEMVGSVELVATETSPAETRTFSVTRGVVRR